MRARFFEKNEVSLMEVLIQLSFSLVGGLLMSRASPVLEGYTETMAPKAPRTPPFQARFKRKRLAAPPRV